uniref:Uncharacterized protein n=1 Tax=Nelumbo nucifera TaxID=4432 RepID=A0A822Y4U8_NELNU|nr:TPA_asm: hypothetical protein HUJ06_029028 [Nelumbo nucifera]
MKNKGWSKIRVQNECHPSLEMEESDPPTTLNLSFMDKG